MIPTEPQINSLFRLFKIQEIRIHLFDCDRHMPVDVLITKNKEDKQINYSFLSDSSPVEPEAQDVLMQVYGLN